MKESVTKEMSVIDNDTHVTVMVILTQNRLRINCNCSNKLNFIIRFYNYVVSFNSVTLEPIFDFVSDSFYFGVLN